MVSRWAFSGWSMGFLIRPFLCQQGEGLSTRLKAPLYSGQDEQESVLSLAEMMEEKSLQTLAPAFFLQDVWTIARALLGKILVTRHPAGETAVRITEVEAYAGTSDRACHAYGGRRTRRNEPMYQVGGTLYIYLNYGLHHLLNIVTGPEGDPCAVLIRAGEPLWGQALMAERRGLSPEDPRLTVGPGNLTRALAIPLAWSGQHLRFHPQIQILSDGYAPPFIQHGPRIGVDYAGPDARHPWRYWIGDTPFVSNSRKKPNLAGSV